MSDEQLSNTAEQTGKSAILAQRAALEAEGITFVAAHFEGSGDEGITEDVRCYDTSEYSYDDDLVAFDATNLQGHFDSLVPSGYEYSSGGFGDVVFDVRAGKITIIRNDYEEDYSTSTREV
jgi:hypothetical protein